MGNTTHAHTHMASCCKQEATIGEHTLHVYHRHQGGSKGSNESLQSGSDSDDDIDPFLFEVFHLQ